VNPPAATFVEDTAVRHRSGTRFRGHLAEHWLSLVGIHGGYAAAVVARAIEQAVADPHRPLRSLAVQFAAVPRPGDADIDVTVHRSGRTTTSSSAVLTQSGEIALVAQALSAAARPGVAYDDCPPPRGTIPRGVDRFRPPGLVAHFANVDVRLDPDVTPFSGAGEALVAAWIRPLEDEPIDAAWVVAMGDVLPPAVFSRTTGPVKAATLTYTVHLANGAPQLPASTYAYLSCRSPHAAQGFAAEHGTMWDHEGRVLAITAQTRLAGEPLAWGPRAGARRGRDRPESLTSSGPSAA
jgi:acyl-CoA thioesterase